MPVRVGKGPFSILFDKYLNIRDRKTTISSLHTKSMREKMIVTENTSQLKLANFALLSLTDQ